MVVGMMVGVFVMLVLRRILLRLAASFTFSSSPKPVLGLSVEVEEAALRASSHRAPWWEFIQAKVIGRSRIVTNVSYNMSAIGVLLFKQMPQEEGNMMSFTESFTCHQGLREEGNDDDEGCRETVTRLLAR